VSSFIVMCSGSRIGGLAREGPFMNYDAKLKSSLTAIDMDGKNNSEVAF
jgi:hypothetical protein